MNKLLKIREFKYLSVFVVLVLIILSMSVKPILTDVFGDEIYIKTAAYDPRDVFRGDYVSLNYEISEISIDKLDYDALAIVNNDLYSNELSGEKLYVSLIRGDFYYSVDKVSLTKPSEGIYLVARYNFTLWDFDINEKENNERFEKVRGIMVEYPLDRFYVPENTGKALEKKVRDGDAFARIKVYKGYALLKGIH